MPPTSTNSSIFAVVIPVMSTVEKDRSPVLFDLFEFAIGG
jgi:hypothetical protein